jgi:hypothetical protein
MTDHDKHFIVRIRQGRSGERSYPTERHFGSKVTRRKVAVGTTIEGETRYRILYGGGVWLTVHEVLSLLQRELRREGVDRVTILAV